MPADDASQDLKTRASKALTYLMGEDPALAEKAWADIKRACGGVMPGAAAMALVWTATAYKQAHGEQQ